MRRDSKGRFTKKGDEGLKIIFGIPSFKQIIVWILIIGIFMPWLSIIWRLNIIKKIMDLFDDLVTISPNTEVDGAEKGGLFY